MDAQICFNHSKVLGRMREKGLRQKDIAQAISCSTPTISQKLNNHSTFTASEIVSICNLLEIETQEVGAYFFTPKVQKLGICEGAAL